MGYLLADHESARPCSAVMLGPQPFPVNSLAEGMSVAPHSMLQNVVYDNRQVATPTDILPLLYYLLGHRPIEHNLILGRPLFTQTGEELDSYRRKDIFFVSDARSACGILSDNARYMYLTYDSPVQGFFYDLSVDPDGRHDIVSPEIEQRSNDRIIDYLFAIGRFYGYTPPAGATAS